MNHSFAIAILASCLILIFSLPAVAASDTARNRYETASFGLG